MTMTGDGQPHTVRTAALVAEDVMAIVAQTVQFLLLNPQAWPSRRISDDERREVEAAVTRLTAMRGADLASQPCPLCEHTGACATGCPVFLARSVVMGGGRQ